MCVHFNTESRKSEMSILLLQAERGLFSQKTIELLIRYYPFT